jgi:hypothetical protein
MFMSLGWLLRLFAIAVIPAVPSVQAQQAPAPTQESFLTWEKVPPSESGLVLIIDGNVSLVTLSDEKKTVLDDAKWIFGPTFIRQYRVTPGTFQLRLFGEPISSIDVNAKAGSLTYVRLAPYRPTADTAGTRITGWVGVTTSDVRGLLAQAVGKGLRLNEVFVTPHIDAPAKTYMLTLSHRHGQYRRSSRPRPGDRTIYG